MKRWIATLLVLALLISLVGCGSASSSSQPAGDTSQAEGEHLSGTIEYWSSWSETEPQADVISRAAEEFMKQNPDVTINITWNGRDLVS